MKEFDVPKDLLPQWGPYSKKYMGISRIVEDAPIPGARFDCVVHPMLANSNQPAPNVTFPSSWHIWEAAPDLSFFACRVELEWKDRVYADVSFSAIDDHTRLIRTEYVNNTGMDQNCVLNYYMAMEYPWKQTVKVSCDGSFVWKKLTNYDILEYHTPRAFDHLMPDGLHRGEFFDPSFTEGRGFGERIRQAFGQEKGDRVTVSLFVKERYERMALRCRAVGEKAAVFSYCIRGEGGAVYTEGKIELLPAEEPDLVFVSVKTPENGVLSLTLVSEGEGGAEFDFAAFLKEGARLCVERKRPGFVPQCDRQEAGYSLRYPAVAQEFGFCPLTDSLRLRSIPTGTLEDALVSRLSQADPTFDEVLRTFTDSFREKHSDEGFYQNFIVHSIFIPAGKKHVEYALLGDGRQRRLTCREAEALYEKKRGALAEPCYNSDGEGYAFSNRLLQAALLTNVVYPIYRHGEWIRHHTPGKRWDSLYTWDSGFIGLGLLECEERLAQYVLDLYLSRPDNPDFAFLMHGSPVPVQAYLYLELLQRSGDKERLFAWYPRLKRYYSFLAGKSEGSATDPFESRLTTTFDYFYNCSGMDDLPPQVEMYRQSREKLCAPAFTTSQLIRMAKILRMIAREQELLEDVKEYEEDIALRANALLTYAWDEESGYFGYVVHDKQKRPIGVLRTADGENLSKGMDGVYPLVAGICSKEQEERLLGHIFSEKEMFSKVGISAVDMSASYYQPNGYWNGNVWFSHQWFLWKTMLDLGKMEEAWKIAKTALDSWKREVDYSYYTFEMLNIATARGGWFHQFGGLSSPVNIWANAYYRRGTVSCGFDLWIGEQSYEEDTDTFRLTVTNHSDRAVGLLLVTGGADTSVPEVSLDGEPLEAVRRTLGALECRIPARVRKGRVVAKARV